ncbi:uncharacterized protein LOC117293001 [Asterias rubens]|uniref:uncharacterized protein LOC117293001 n=1 Tax=Asterias rubens TaxID=7604 RepID=UPI001454E83D|nr:uncharacterized protein LOC117293001 [Asterias rubens]
MNSLSGLPVPMKMTSEAGVVRHLDGGPRALQQRATNSPLVPLVVSGLSSGGGGGVDFPGGHQVAAVRLQSLSVPTLHHQGVLDGVKTPHSNLNYIGGRSSSPVCSAAANKNRSLNEGENNNKTDSISSTSSSNEKKLQYPFVQ